MQLPRRYLAALSTKYTLTDIDRVQSLAVRPDMNSVAFGAVRNMAMTAARRRGFGKRVIVFHQEAAILILEDHKFEEWCLMKYFTTVVLSAMTKLEQRTTQTGLACICIVNVLVCHGLDCNEPNHATILILTCRPGMKVRWAYYDPHGMHSPDVAAARSLILRACTSFDAIYHVDKIRGRAGEDSLQTDLNLCLYYSGFAVYALAYNGPDEVESVLAALHDVSFVHNSRSCILTWVTDVMWQIHPKLPMGTPVHCATFTVDGDIVKRAAGRVGKLDKLTRTYESELGPIPFMLLFPRALKRTVDK